MTDNRGPKNALVVLVDDDEATRLSIGQMLRLRGYAVEMFASAAAALSSRSLPTAGCVVTDIKMPGMDGEGLLAEIVKKGLSVPVIMITGHGDIGMAVRCLKSGAYDFQEKPFDDDLLIASVSRALEISRLRSESEAMRRRLELLEPSEDGRFGLIGRSRSMQDLHEQIAVCAGADAPVLICGETGAGKELVARAIHRQSARANGPFVAVNASALPETMLESELFGHTKGAFTGAHSDRDGKFVSASGGTLLLDEIENIAMIAQVQLLRVLDDSLVQPLGSDRTRKVNVRFLATTKDDLRERVRCKLMRDDFYHRIVVLTVAVPPLRERREDIPLLLTHFLKASSANANLPVPSVPENTLAALLDYPWPGNVRELKHAVERMVITSRDGVCGPPTLGDTFGPARLLSLPATPGRLRDRLEAAEAEEIRTALLENRGVIGDTAQTLGVSRRALYERMKKYGIDKDAFRA